MPIQSNNVGSVALRDSLTRGREFESLGDALRLRNDANVADIGQEQGRLVAGASSAVQQKFRTGGGSFAKKLEQNIRRGKARQGIQNRGDAAIRNQQLKDRLIMARQSVTRRGAIQGAATSASRIRSGLQDADQRAKDRVSQAQAGMFGGIAGGVARGFGGSLFGSPETPVGVESSGSLFSDSFSQGGLTTAGQQIGGVPLVGGV